MYIRTKRYFPQQDNINSKKERETTDPELPLSQLRQRQSGIKTNPKRIPAKFPLTSSAFVHSLSSLSLYLSLSRERIGKVSNNYPGVQEFLLARKKW